MATYPIKVLLDRNRQPFIPFATTSSIVENGTNRRLDKMLGNLDDLQTNNKNSLVSAINEIRNSGGSGGSSTGWLVVDKLPTENISATTIYLVPKEGSKKPNIYEEWVWVNNDWENIGTTEIDLSGYATTSMIGDLNTLQTTDKDCIVDAINEIVGTAGGTSANIGNLNDLNTEDKSSIVNAINEVMSGGCAIYFLTNKSCPSSGSALSLTDKEKEIMNEIVNKVFENQSKENILLVVNFSIGYPGNYIFAVDNYRTFTNGTRCVELKPLGQPVTGHMLTSNESCIKYITYSENGECYVYHEAISYALKTKVLQLNNTTAYTPTANYHPATKKYVDDSIAAAGGGGGGGSNFDPAKYLAIDNTTEYTPTDLYHPATKAYVDGLIANVPEPVDAYSKTEVDGKLANYLSKTNTESYTPTSDYHPATKKFVESVVASINIPNVDLTGYYTKAEVYNKQEIDTKLEDLDVYTKGEVDNAIDGAIDELDFTKYYTKTETDNKFMNYLSKDNTVTYTPTLDYHPTTKKYVDDSIDAIEIPPTDLSNYYTKGEVDDAINGIEFPTTDLSGYYTRAEINTMVKAINNRASKFTSLSRGVFNAASSLTGTKAELEPLKSGDYCYGNGVFTAQPDSNALFKFTGVKKLKLTIAANIRLSSELGVTIMRQDVGSSGFIIDRFGAERAISEETYNNNSLWFSFKDNTEEDVPNRQEQSFVLTGLNSNYTYRFINTAYAYGKVTAETSTLSDVEIIAEVIE